MSRQTVTTKLAKYFAKGKNDAGHYIMESDSSYAAMIVLPFVDSERVRATATKLQESDTVVQMIDQIYVKSELVERWQRHEISEIGQDDAIEQHHWPLSEISFCFFSEAGQMSLSAFLDSRHWKPSWTEVLSIGNALGRALESIHALSLAHTDVDPRNLFVFPGGLWKLGALSVRSHFTATSAHQRMRGVPEKGRG